MLRTITAVLFAVVWLIVMTPVLGIEWIIGKFNKPLEDKSSLHLVQRALGFIVKICGVDLTIIGKERIPKDRAVLYACNHRSYFDIIIGYSLMPDLTGYISKDTLKKVPLLRRWMMRLYCLFLDRDDPRQGIQMIKDASANIEKGISMCIFPEGTRNHGEEGTLLEFKRGSFKIAEKTGCPVVPIAVSNSAEIIGNHMPKVTPCHVILEYGEPIYTDQMDRKEQKKLHIRTQEAIQKMLDEHADMI